MIITVGILNSMVMRQSIVILKSLLYKKLKSTRLLVVMEQVASILHRTKLIVIIIADLVNKTAQTPINHSSRLSTIIHLVVRTATCMISQCGCGTSKRVSNSYNSSTMKL